VIFRDASRSILLSKVAIGLESLGIFHPLSLYLEEIKSFEETIRGA